MLYALDSNNIMCSIYYKKKNAISINNIKTDQAEEIFHELADSKLKIYTQRRAKIKRVKNDYVIYRYHQKKHPVNYGVLEGKDIDRRLI